MTQGLAGGSYQQEARAFLQPLTILSSELQLDVGLAGPVVLASLPEAALGGRASSRPAKE